MGLPMLNQDKILNLLLVLIFVVLNFQSFEEAVSYNNEVKQGLSSSIFTKDISKVFNWMG